MRGQKPDEEFKRLAATAKDPFAVWVEERRSAEVETHLDRFVSNVRSSLRFDGLFHTGQAGHPLFLVFTPFNATVPQQLL